MSIKYEIFKDNNGDEYAEFHGYWIYKDGRVYNSKSNRFLKGTKRDNKVLMMLTIDGEHIKYTVKKLIYHIFVNSDIPPIGNHDYVFICKDGNEDNLSVDNIKAMQRDEYVRCMSKKRDDFNFNKTITLDNAQVDHKILFDETDKEYVMFEGYLIYKDGTVVKEKTNSIIAGFMDSSGVKRVELLVGTDNKKKRFSLKKLIAHCFIYSPMPPNGAQKYRVICNDEDETNVAADNLTVVFKE